MHLNIPKLLLFFLLALFAVNILQSTGTALLLDEAYYWYYAQDLAWGYFDHPPMVAWMIALGEFFASGELGVRLLSCVLYPVSLLLLWILLEHPHKEKYVWHFCILALAPPLFHAYGFLTLPDTALLCCTTWFLLIYKRFLTQATWANALLLGLVMAAMMYSKYHALLVILFVFFSNPGLVKSKYAWAAVIVALACYLPHLKWLVEHDFISLRYHLSERPFSPYNFANFTLGYLLNLMALFGLIFPLAYYSLIKSRPTDLFNRALIFIAYGFILFFLFTSFSKRVQAQWLVVITIPLILLTFNYMAGHPGIRKWVLRLGTANIILLGCLRIWMVNGAIFPIPFETHFSRSWTSYLKERVGDLPVVFENSYANAATYAFYSGSYTYSLNNTHYRLNQYSIDDSEKNVQHKRILYVSKYLNNPDFTFIGTNGDEYKAKYMEPFESFRKLDCSVGKQSLSLQDSASIILKVYNPYPVDIDLKKLKFGATYLNHYKRDQEVAALAPTPLNPDTRYLQKMDTTFFNITLPKPKNNAMEYVRFSISENGLYYGYNSKNIKLY